MNCQTIVFGLIYIGGIWYFSYFFRLVAASHASSTKKEWNKFAINKKYQWNHCFRANCLQNFGLCTFRGFRLKTMEEFVCFQKWQFTLTQQNFTPMLMLINSRWYLVVLTKHWMMMTRLTVRTLHIKMIDTKITK